MTDDKEELISEEHVNNLETSENELLWKEEALAYMDLFYQNYGGHQWHEFSKISENDQALMITDICYAIFGSPTMENRKIENDEDQKSIDSIIIEEIYSNEQRKMATKIKEKILQASDPNLKDTVRFLTIFIIGHFDDKTIPIPVFRVYSGIASGFRDKSQYVDTYGRIYRDWDGWKKDNKLPKMEYCIPKNGFYTCHPRWDYDFDQDKSPICEFSESPSSSLLSKVVGVTDVVSGITSLGTGGVLITSSLLTTPLAPVVLTTAVAAGGVAAVYCVGR